MKIKSKTMLGVSLLTMTFSFSATAQTCKPVPTCAELGYTETSCSGDSLKCPFDTSKLYCVETATETIPLLGLSFSTMPKAGDIFYTDGSYSGTYNSSKTVVGVVAGDEKRGFVIVDTTNANSNKPVKGSVTDDTCRAITKGTKKARVPTAWESVLLIGANIDAVDEGLAKIPNSVALGNFSPWTATTVSGSNNAEAYYMNYPSCKGGLSTQTLQVYERIGLKLLKAEATKYDHFVRCVFDF